MKNLSIITACVDYADFLSITLPRTLLFSKNVTVITAEHDKETRRVCRRYGVNCIVTDAWYANGTKFDKASALNLGIDNIETKEWILSMDADIYLPIFSERRLRIHLDEQALHTCVRRECRSYNDFITKGDKNFHSYRELHHPGLSRKDSPRNVLGYFQLWHYPTHQFRFKPSEDASLYDLEFTSRFEKCVWLPFSVLHFGYIQTNWEGRKTCSWLVPEETCEERCSDFHS